MWASRAQAQNAADAGALAGAVALAFDDPSDFSNGGPAKQNAFEATQRNLVWGNAPTVDIATDITVPYPCPADVGGGTSCIRVDVHRSQATGNPLPMFFGQLFGRGTQDMRASAVAQVGGANAAKCMLPFALADRWADNVDPTPDTTTFANDDLVGTAGWTNNDLYEVDGTDPDDEYVAPYTSPHTGWTTGADFGRQLILHEPVGKFSAGWSGIVELPGLGTGGDVFRDSLWNCDFNNTWVGVAAEDEDCESYDPAGTTIAQGLAGCLGVKTGWVAGPARQGVTGPGGGPDVEPLITQDTASWVGEGSGLWCGPNGTDDPEGCVVDASGARNMGSPRIRPLAVFDLVHYMSQDWTGSTGIVKVVNIVGFFVEGLCADVKAAGGLDMGNDCDPDSLEDYQVVGRIVQWDGNNAGAGAPVTESSFLKTVRLVR
jgi:hypothetical protein